MLKSHSLLFGIAFSVCGLVNVPVSHAQSFSAPSPHQVGQDDAGRDELEHGAQVTPISGSEKSSWMPEWKMPAMPWSKPSKPTITSYKKKEETSWDKFSKGSKKFWAKTAEVLDPYPEPKPAGATDKKPSMFSGWFKQDDGKKVETVNDFLGQQRID